MNEVCNNPECEEALPEDRHWKQVYCDKDCRLRANYLRRDEQVLHYAKNGSLACGNDIEGSNTTDNQDDATCGLCSLAPDHGADYRVCRKCGEEYPIEVFLPLRGGVGGLDPLSGEPKREASCYDCSQLPRINKKRAKRGLKPLPSMGYTGIQNAQYDPELFDYQNSSYNGWIRLARTCPKEWWYEHLVNGIEEQVII